MQFKIWLENVSVTPKTVLDMIEWHDSFYDLYPGYSEPSIKGKDYYFKSARQATQWAKDIIGIFTAFPAQVPVYRAIYAPNEKAIDLINPGEHWSWDRQSAINFGLRGGGNYLLSAVVDSSGVDWLASIRVYIDFSQHYSNEDEHELVIADESKLSQITVAPLPRR